MEITDKQISYISWQINAQRSMSDELKQAFPDDLRDGANHWRDNFEKRLQNISRDTASEIITMLRDEDENGFTYLINELNQTN